MGFIRTMMSLIRALRDRKTPIVTPNYTSTRPVVPIADRPAIHQPTPQPIDKPRVASTAQAETDDDFPLRKGVGVDCVYDLGKKTELSDEQQCFILNAARAACFPGTTQILTLDRIRIYDPHGRRINIAPGHLILVVKSPEVAAQTVRVGNRVYTLAGVRRTADQRYTAIALG